MVVVGGGWLKAERERRVWCVVCVVCVFRRGFVEEEEEEKKTNPLLLADCRPLVHLFSCRCLQMWSAD
ncbi:hypothetical protein HanPI659440_Chr13g0522871 [Helianthus annuus]|nr:hypothetical protein HanPI659440_Chr13g0522871 [Helianthus annuus]